MSGDPTVLGFTLGGIGTISAIYILFIRAFIEERRARRDHIYPIPGWRINKQSGKVEQWNWIGDGHWMERLYDDFIKAKEKHEERVQLNQESREKAKREIEN